MNVRNKINVWDLAFMRRPLCIQIHYFYNNIYNNIVLLMFSDYIIAQKLEMWPCCMLHIARVSEV